ncbi:MAG: hypothetical protein IT170_06520 [Bryobacterales bacterium]|nr:hypothetical protein [Bryobacterales bacterium]
MMTELEAKTRQALEAAIGDALTEDAMKRATKRFQDACSELQTEMEFRLQSDLAYNLCLWVQRMFEDAVKAMLLGDDETMRRHLSCSPNQYSGRDRDHPIIHGKLFETGAIELRKQIVNAHAELLKDERILDLEDQVRSLVKQVNQKEAEKNAMWERVRYMREAD